MTDRDPADDPGHRRHDGAEDGQRPDVRLRLHVARPGRAPQEDHRRGDDTERYLFFRRQT